MLDKKKARRVLLKTLLLVVSLSVGLALAECITRVFLPEVSDTFIVQTKNHNCKYHHPFLGPVPPAPRLDAVRIMFIGDSFTFGSDVSNVRTQAFPPLTGKFLSEGSVEGVAPRAVQAVNLGNPSYSPSIYGLVLRDYAPVIKPDIVVLCLDDSDPHDDLLYSNMLVTDNQGLPLSVYPRIPRLPDFLLPVASRVKLVRLMAKLCDRVCTRFDRNRELLNVTNRWGHYRPGGGSERQWAEAFERSLKLVDAFYRYCKDHKIKLVIINYPYAPAVTTKYVTTFRKGHHFDTGIIHDPTFHKAVRDFALARDISYYDFTPYLRALPDLEGVYNEKDRWGHYSEKGYELLARELAKFLSPFVDEVTAARQGDPAIAHRGARPAAP